MGPERLYVAAAKAVEAGRNPDVQIVLFERGKGVKAN